MLSLSGQFQSSQYHIQIGTGLLARPELFLPYITGNQVAVITHPCLLPYLEQIKQHFQNIQFDFLLIPEGENQKSLSTVEHIISFLISHKHRRNTTLIALGGGVIGDTTGFTSSIYMRGANFIYIPTTLLAQVDATLGGKCAVNHALGKNLIGAFHHPQQIIIDIDTLSTLPDRHYQAGLVEAIKHGIALDSNFFFWIKQQIKQIELRTPAILSELIYKSLAIKQRIVSTDEKDLLGKRALLNFGHTFGHALEAATHHQLLHGEAVAIGMKIATFLSFQLNLITQDELQQITSILNCVYLPQLTYNFNFTSLKDYLCRDKKNVSLQLNMILLNGIGSSTRQDISWHDIETHLNNFFNHDF